LYAAEPDLWAEARFRLAPWLLGLALIGYAAYALSVLLGVDWIGHADYADNAVVARNLAAGRGPVIDYVPQFYRFYAGITHPADTWPPLQPLLIAPGFLLLGAQTWVAKLPNLVVLLALAVAVYHFAGRWWDRRVALLAALLTLLHPYFFQTVLYPINDLAFTLLALLTIGWAWETLAVGSRQYAVGSDDEGLGGGGWGSGRVGSRQDAVGSGAGLGVGDRGVGTDSSLTTPAVPNPKSKIQNPKSVASSNNSKLKNVPAAPLRDQNSKLPALAGLAAGLLIWSKGPSAVVVLGGLGLALAAAWHTARWAGRRPAYDWRPGRWAVGAAVLVVGLLVARNLLVFGVPFTSTESYDVWLLRLNIGGTGPSWEQIYADYLGRPLPQPALLLYSYDALYQAVAWGFTTLWTSGVLKGDILALPICGAGLAGWALAPSPLRGLRTTWIGTFLVYGLVVLLAWHYESRYFLVVVPWFYLGTAALAVGLGDYARRGLTRRARPFRLLAGGGLALAVGLVLALPGPALLDIAERAKSESHPDTFAAAGRWAAANLPATAVVMTRNPWEFNWYAQRRAVMIPEGSLADIQAVAARYGVTYLWLGGPADPTSARATPVRLALTPLYRREPLPGWPAQRVYDQDGILIYRLGR
ncbi:MAG TPA: glycosyltransferase family 39 protein, partial [Chloroflexia bacterium]|nr:glycosyltransferase family 39 protein [Chloroflexia bacterium]